MKNNNKIMVLGIVMVLVALAASVFLVSQNQETRKSAAFDTSTLQILPSLTINANVGDVFAAQLEYYTTANSKVDGVQTQVCYGVGVSLASIDVNTDAGFNSSPITATTSTSGGMCTTIVVTSQQAAASLLTTGRAFTMYFKGISAGSGNLSLSTSTSQMTGDNSASATDKNITVTGVTGTSYVISGSGSPTPTQTTTGLLLKFKMTYLGVLDSAQCADPATMPLTVIVRATDGTMQTYNNVIATKLSGGTTVNGQDLGVYEVSLRLGSLNYSSGLAVFIKDARHLQVKYGVDGQSVFYNKAGGELSGLTTDDASTPVFDFTKYPLLAGDVTGANETQDGVVDGLDFSYVKTQAIARTAVAAGGYMLSDLNGNCKMESQDLAILMLSLSEKQGQLY